MTIANPAVATGILTVQTPATGNAYTIAVTRQGTTTPALYLGATAANLALIASNNTDLRFGFDAGGVFTTTLDIATSGTALFFGNIQFNSTSTQGIIGTTAIDNALAGNVGEYKAQTSVSPGTTLTTAVSANITTTLVLGAGDWDISCVISVTQITGGTITVTSIRGGIMTASATFTGNEGDNWVYSGGTLNGGTNVFMSIPNFRVSINTNTNYFLVAQIVYVGTPTIGAFGRISARRVEMRTNEYSNLVVNGNMSANIVSVAIPLQQAFMCGIQAVYTGAPVGSLFLTVSNDGITYSKYNSSDNPQAITAAGNYYWIIPATPFNFLKLNYTVTSGTGTLNATSSYKGT